MFIRVCSILKQLFNEKYILIQYILSLIAVIELRLILKITGDYSSPSQNYMRKVSIIVIVRAIKRHLSVCLLTTTTEKVYIASNDRAKPIYTSHGLGVEPSRGQLGPPSSQCCPDSSGLFYCIGSRKFRNWRPTRSVAAADHVPTLRK